MPTVFPVLGLLACVALPGSAQGDPEVTFPADGSANDDAFGLLVDVVRRLQPSGSQP